jgi:hypothetical protein
MTTRPPNLHPLAWEYLCAEWHECRAGGLRGRLTAYDDWRSEGCPLLDDDLDDEGNPIPQPADPRLLALANRALGEQLDEARAEVERLAKAARDEARGFVVEMIRADLHAQINDLGGEPPEGDFPPLGAYIGRLANAADAVVRERDEAREQVESLRNNEVALVDAHNAREAWLTAEVESLRAQLRGVGVEEYLAATAEVSRLRAEVERLLTTGACECPAEDVCRLTAEREEARAAYRAVLADRDRLVGEVERLRTEHDQLREARRRKLADLEAHARKLETYLQGLALETLTPVGHDDTAKALARGALRYLDAALELTEVDDG